MKSPYLKELAKNFLPPVLANYFRNRQSIRNSNAFNEHKWDNLILNANSAGMQVDEHLKIIVKDYLASSDFSDTSKYWKHLIQLHLGDLVNFGLENYGKNVARHYFSWADYNDKKIGNIEFKTKESKSLLDILKIHPGFSASASFKHNTLIELVFRHILNLDLLEELGQVKLTGYKFGSHPFLQYQHQFLTLDLLTSFLEYRSLNNHLKFSENSNPILEIGAGSGRFAEMFLNFNGANKYVIADIPPAIFISFKRLQLIYPEKRIIYVSDKLTLNSYVESEEWDIIFILPWLLMHFPQKFFKISIAIDCLHEMTDKQRGFLINMAESKSENFYLKVWDETYLPLDNIKLDIRNEKHYFTKPHWKVVFSNSCIFPGDYKEICYEFSK